jgi:hypothetical protein
MVKHPSEGEQIGSARLHAIFCMLGNLEIPVPPVRTLPERGHAPASFLIESGRSSRRGAKRVIATSCSYRQGPSSAQTMPQGQPVPPGAQLTNMLQFTQLPSEQSQLRPPRETVVPGTYRSQPT